MNFNKNHKDMKFTVKLSTMLMGVVLLSVLAGCQKEADKASVNPTYDPETQTVKTDFVLSISTGTGKDTKTTAEMAQVGTNAKFLGMDQVHLLAYELDENNYNADHGHFFFRPVVNGKPVAATRDYDLGTLFGASAITTDQSSRSVELSLPLKTNSVAFYGKATKTYDSDLQGSVLMSGNPKDLRTLTFGLESRLTGMDKFDVGAFCFSRIFNYIMCAALVNESTFWSFPTGSTDRSYGFWWPLPTAEEIASGFPENPDDQDTYTMPGEGGRSFTYYQGQLSWKQLGYMYYYLTDEAGDATDPNTLVKTKNNIAFENRPLGEVLGSAYYSMTTIKSSGSYQELRAGSATSVLRTINDLYAIVDRGVHADPTSWEEYCVKLLCEQIRSRMLNFFMLENEELNYLKKDGKFDVATLKTRIESSTSPSDWSTIKDKVSACSDEELIAYFPNISAGYYGFPVNVGLPFGASIITCNADMADQRRIDRFEYVKNIPAYGFGTTTFPIANYRYPPELMYYGSSALRTSAQPMKSADYPSSVGAWDTEEQWASWTKFGEVTSSTRSVSMVNNVNYGTALLASTVRFAGGVTALKDNNHALHNGEEDNNIAVNTGGGFLVTGIIVGGQADVMGWDYVRRPNEGDYASMVYDASQKKFTGASFDQNPFDKMIYDRVVNGYKVSESTTPIYTLVWDNYDATLPADQQSDVYVGLELMNNTGEDFWGEMNLVRSGGVFYLLGKLDLSVAVENAGTAFDNLSREYYCYPPFDPATGNTINAPRVFMQDYMTKADLILGADCLKHAYVTLPDLRSSQISLGVSIDMSWTPGLAFEVNMGEN